MPHEAILVVDDAPVNLKLTGILLRKEGYDVHSAVDAEQALELLETFHPDLMLVDIQLPGMDGLELTRLVKGNSRTRNIVVVALTACAMKGDDEKAFKAGCEGYITKPIETGTLAGRIREYLDRRKAPPMAVDLPAPPAPLDPFLLSFLAQPAAAEPRPRPHGLPGGLSFTPAEMEGLRRRFLEDTSLQVRLMAESLTRSLDVPNALRTCREWAAAAAVLDYQAIGILIHQVERHLSAPNPDHASLDEALSDLMIGLAEAPESVTGPVPDPIVAVLKGKRVALVGFSADDADRLCVALERASAKPRYFDYITARDSEPLREFNLVLVGVSPATRDTFLLAAGPHTFTGPPLVLAGARDQILALDHGVQLRACELLIDGWQPEEVLMRLALALGRRQATPVVAAAANNGASLASLNGSNQHDGSNSEVLIADDDMTVRLVVRSALEKAGIKCRVAVTGPEALQMLREYHPRAAILDVNMPGMDGYEVLSAARLDGIPTHIMLLTARQQEADITRGFTLGADDYLIKPFNPPELVARLKRFLQPYVPPRKQ